MHQEGYPYDGLRRREFLRAGLGALCAMYASVGVGCVQKPRSREEPPRGLAQRGLVNPTPSPWFSRLDGARIRCELCPRRCELVESERGPCRVRENRRGVGHTLVYGNPALVQEDPVERKPFFHVIPGSRALSIATAGCNLACEFCEVWDLALVRPEQVHAHDMPPERVVEHARATRVRAISYAFGEPVVSYEYVADVAALARRAGLLNLIHTAGYIQPEPLRRLCRVLDAANVDLKSFDPAFYRKVVGGELRPVLTTLMLLSEAGVHIEVTNLVIPTLNDDVDMIRRMSRWIVNELGAGVPVHFARFYPLYRLTALPRTPVSTLDRARETAMEAGLRYVYVARVTGHQGENTFCHGCGKTVIRRVGYVIDEVHLDGGRCRYCGAVIPGRWG